MPRVTRKPLVWPPKVGQRICRDTGHLHNSWSAEVRAIVDDDVAVLRRWRKHKGWHTYELLEKLDVEIGNDREGRAMYYEGTLPRRRVSQIEGGET